MGAWLATASIEEKRNVLLQLPRALVLHRVRGMQEIKLPSFKGRPILDIEDDLMDLLDHLVCLSCGDWHFMAAPTRCHGPIKFMGQPPGQGT